MELQFSISPSNEYSGQISFRIDWYDLLAVQGTLKSLLQRHSSKASILQCSAFFMVQLSHPYMITGKTIAWTIWTLSLLFNMLSRFFIAFLPRSKCLLISWLHLPCAVILEPKKIACHCLHCCCCCCCSVTSVVSNSVGPHRQPTRQEHWSGLPYPSLMHESEK